MLLMSLDAGTASELLKGVDAQVVQELAVELAHLDAAGYRSNKQNAEIARQFCDSLQTKQVFHLNSFLNEMLKNTVGVEKAEQIQTQIQDLLLKRDPFIPIRSANTQAIAAVLEYEHPQAAAVVLSELPAKKSSEVLGLLGEGIRLTAISRMTSSETVTAEAKTRIAEAVCKRLEAFTSARSGGAAADPEQSLRKVAVILRNLGKELREGLLGAIQKADDQAGAKVADLMIIWDDVPQVADRSLQEALRAIDAKQLALALFKADEVIAEKIRSNISKQAAAALDEQASLMVTPEKEDVESARAKVIKTLAETDKKIGLAFTEGEIG
ncbi:MAG: hypothetical protein KAY65_11235 [Planctomycetes bacterium]|nr:hypothetical protein [Planctomycetota bacterium]